jgi:medium-chain acyl-[acyl-carrier-protein] hydrolase
LGTCLHQLPDQEFIEEVQARFAGIPDAILQEREILDIMLPILRADLAVCETYQYSQGERLSCPISVFGGLEDHWIRPSDLEAWSAQTSAEFNVQMYPGDHFFINGHRRSIVQNVARVLKG